LEPKKRYLEEGKGDRVRLTMPSKPAKPGWMDKKSDPPATQRGRRNENQSDSKKAQVGEV